MYNLNYGQIGGGTASEPQAKYGITGSVTYVDPIVSDVYEALQVRVAKRFSNGFQSQIAYTYSHDIGFTPSILIPQYRNYDRYTTSLDRPNAFVWSASYQLPFGQGKKYLKSGIAAQIAGGWTINGLFTHYSGIPFSITSSSASCNCPGNTQTANQILPSVSYVGSGLNGQPFFNPVAFAPVTAVGFGNAGFDTLRGPDSTNLDLNLFRDFRVTERTTIQIRADSFNITNTPHFSNPASNVSNLQLNLSRQYENVLIGQSRNVLLTGLTLEVANLRTTTHESGRSGSIGGFEESQGQEDDAAASGRRVEDERATGETPTGAIAKGRRPGGAPRTARALQPAN